MDSWNRLSYARRLYLWLVGYSLLLVGCVVVFQYRREKEFKADELNSRLQIINAYISAQLDDGVPIDSIRLDSSRLLDGIRISIIDEDGDVVYDNSLDRLPGSNHLNREEIAEAVRYGEGFTLRRHSESTGSTYFYSATRADDGAIIRTAVPYSVSLTALLEADYTFLWIMGGITLVFCTLGFFATRRVGLHVRRLSDFAAGAERGDMISDSEPFPHDELGDISNHIVRLYARLQQAIADRDREHARAMQQQREKERVKKQLTNDINHELKTPVASIQLCLETLMAYRDMPEEKRMEFLQRCLSNTERLRRLLEDVSLITRMDDGGKVISRERLDLAAVIASVVEDFRQTASGKGITLDNEVVSPIPMVGNAQLLESVFQNLIGNALSHSGASCITLRTVHMDNSRVVLTVADDGCGVGPEHLPRLFDRFYRVDKGRSRATGGTGLGLAIVKNAIHLHGGSIKVSNRASGGLVFTVSLPRKRSE